MSMGYKMGKQDYRADRAKRLALRYPDRVTHVEAPDDAENPPEMLNESDDAALDEVPEDAPERKKGGRPKGSKNKKADD